MEMPNYDGIIEKWKINLIISRAKRYGFKPHELPDALQEVVLVVLEFKYDPDHAKGATECTALVPIINNRLLKMKRAAACYRTHVERFGQNATEFSRDTVDPRVMDVASVITGLSPREQAVCRGLAEGMTVLHLAKEMDCSWHTVARIMRRLREHFETLGLDGWVQE